MLNKQNYIRGIDGLRAIAVLAVMLFHLDAAFLPGGFSGVDVFFVISGYVVCASLMRNTPSERGLATFLVDFYARRIVRIYPALVVCLVSVGLLYTLFIPDSWLSDTTDKTGLFAFFGASNFALVMFDDGYFSPRAEFNIFTHTWSLGVEEQFYLLFPFIVYFWSRPTAGRAIGVYLLPGLLLASLAYAALETAAAPSQAYYLLPSRFWELAAGGLLYQLHSKGLFTARTALAQQGSLLVGVLLTAAGFVYASKQAFPFPYALLPVLGSCLLIVGVASKAASNSILLKLFESRPFIQIGKTSYSLYLWHWPVYVLFRWTCGLETLAEYALAVVLVFALANLSYYVVERRIAKSRLTVHHSSGKLVLGGVVATGICGAITLALYLSQPSLSLSVTKDRWQWYPLAWSAEAPAARDNRFEDRKIFAIGDSHTTAYTTMFQMLADDYGVETVQYFTGACGIATLLRPAATIGEECSKRTRRTLRDFEQRVSPGDILFLASLRMNRLSDQWVSFSQAEIDEAQNSERARAERAAALEETRQLLKRFQQSQVHIVIDAPKPVFRSPPFRCSDWFNRNNPVCSGGLTVSKEMLHEHRRPVMESLATLQAEFPDLITWDPFSALCESEVCSAFNGHQPLFFDGDHLSAHGNRELYPGFSALVKSIWLPTKVAVAEHLK